MIEVFVIEYKHGAVFVKDATGKLVTQYTSQGVDDMSMRTFIDQIFNTSRGYLVPLERRTLTNMVEKLIADVAVLTVRLDSLEKEVRQP
jgi:hypothetical protein